MFPECLLRFEAGNHCHLQTTMTRCDPNSLLIYHSEDCTSNKEKLVCDRNPPNYAIVIFGKILKPFSNFAVYKISLFG